jgi:hypothetical protein
VIFFRCGKLVLTDFGRNWFNARSWCGGASTIDRQWAALGSNGVDCRDERPKSSGPKFFVAKFSCGFPCESAQGEEFRKRKGRSFRGAKEMATKKKAAKKTARSHKKATKKVAKRSPKKSPAKKPARSLKKKAARKTKR